MRSLYLVRHGKPQYPDEHSYCVGQTDFSLSMLGHLQAVLLNEELSDKISGVYCSPLLRTVETAGHMAPELPHIIVSDLSERNLGEWDGLSFDKIRQRWPDIYKARENNPDHPIPGAETPAGLRPDGRHRGERGHPRPAGAGRTAFCLGVYPRRRIPERLRTHHRTAHLLPVAAPLL